MCTNGYREGGNFSNCDINVVSLSDSLSLSPSSEEGFLMQRCGKVAYAIYIHKHTWFYLVVSAASFTSREHFVQSHRKIKYKLLFINPQNELTALPWCDIRGVEKAWTCYVFKLIWGEERGEKEKVRERAF